MSKVCFVWGVLFCGVLLLGCDSPIVQGQKTPEVPPDITITANDVSVLSIHTPVFWNGESFSAFDSMGVRRNLPVEYAIIPPEANLLIDFYPNMPDEVQVMMMPYHYGQSTGFFSPQFNTSFSLQFFQMNDGIYRVEFPAKKHVTNRLEIVSSLSSEWCYFNFEIEVYRVIVRWEGNTAEYMFIVSRICSPENVGDTGES